MVAETEVEKRARQGRHNSVPAVSSATGWSRATLYRAIHRGELKAVWLGRTPMVPAPEALRLLGFNQGGTAA